MIKLQLEVCKRQIQTRALCVFLNINLKKNNIYLINAFAANDYISTLKTWKKWQEWYDFNDYKYIPIIGLFNNRSDRSFRLKQLSDIKKDINFKELIIMDNRIFNLNKIFLNNYNVDINIKRKSKSNKDFIIELSKKYKEDIILFGFGNTKHQGYDMIKFFSGNGVEIKC